MRKWIGIAIVVIGLGVIAFPFVRSYLTDQEGAKLLDNMELGQALVVDIEPVVEGEQDSWIEADGLDDFSYEEDAEDEFQALQLQGELVDAQVEVGDDDGLLNPEDDDGSAIGEIALDDFVEAEALDVEGLKKKRLIAIGKIDIPRIEASLPVVEGAGKTELKYAVGHVGGTADFGRVGNCVLAGHRNLRFGSMFNRMGEMEVGDDIYVTMRDGSIARYVVYETLEVRPGDNQISNYQKDERRLTLVTCTPLGVGSHRLLIRARLDAVQPAEDA